MKIGVLISGRGSNLKALIEACAEPDFRGKIALVISNRPGAAGLAIAEAAGIPTLVIDHKEFSTRETFDAELDHALTKAGVDLVCNAGFMRILTDGFVEKWRDRQLNIHSLWSMTSVGMPAASATASPPAPGLLEITSAIRPRKPGSSQASISALRFEPRPEMRTPILTPCCLKRLSR